MDVAEHGPVVMVVGGRKEVHDLEIGGGHVVEVEKFAVSHATTPNRDQNFLLRNCTNINRGMAPFFRVLLDGWPVFFHRQFCQVEFADEGGNDEVFLQALAITEAIEIARCVALARIPPTLAAVK